MELTAPYALPDPNSTSAAVNFWAIRWRQFDVNGTAWPVFTTYHNVRGRLVFHPAGRVGEQDHHFPQRSGQQRGAGGGLLLLGRRCGGGSRAVFVIYQLTGDNRYMRANMTGRFRLHTGAEDDSRDAEMPRGL